MATIERRVSHGQTVYYAKVRRKGFPPQSATFPKLSEARTWAQRVEVGILEGKVFPAKHTVGELLDRYMSEVLPQKKATTIPTQQGQLLWWKHHIGYYGLSDVTPAKILDYRQRLKGSNSTKNRYTAILSHVFTLALEWEWCQENPVRKLRKLRENPGRTRYLSDEERSRLLGVCKASRNRDLYTLVVISLSTGCRKGELAKLTWNTIDLKKGALTFLDTKNGTNRTVPLTGLALELLREKPQKPGRLYTSNWRKAFETAVKDAGLVDLKWHDLRHSAASYLAMSGAPLLTIAAILGHKSLSMVQRYSHFSDQHLTTALGKMTADLFD